MPTKSLKITYLKSHDYKTSFITGVHGGLASNGLITASFFGDRHALPEMTLTDINENNTVLKTEDIKDSDVVREVQFGVMMDINTTKLIIGWLSNKVREYEERPK
jgi:hypothetical protein